MATMHNKKTGWSTRDATLPASTTDLGLHRATSYSSSRLSVFRKNSTRPAFVAGTTRACSHAQFINVKIYPNARFTSTHVMSQLIKNPIFHKGILQAKTKDNLYYSYLRASRIDRGMLVFSHIFSVNSPQD
jgi:hypothetical protein